MGSGPEQITGWERARMTTWYIFMRPMEGLVQRWAMRRARRTTGLVTSEQVAKATLAAEFIYFVVAIVAMTSIHWLSPGIITSFITIFVGATIGRGTFALVFNQMTYRNGWMKGRSVMFHSMAEAQQRGIAADDWARMEMERDTMMLFGQYEFDLGDDGDQSS